MYIPFSPSQYCLWISPFGVPGLFKSPNYTVTIHDLNFLLCLEDIRQFITSTLIYLFPRPPFRSSSPKPPEPDPRVTASTFPRRHLQCHQMAGTMVMTTVASVMVRVNGDNIISALELLRLFWECYLLGMNQGKEEADIVTVDEENDTVWLTLAPPLPDANSDWLTVRLLPANGLSFFCDTPSICLLFELCHFLPFFVFFCLFLFLSFPHLFFFIFFFPFSFF